LAFLVRLCTFALTSFASPPSSHHLRHLHSFPTRRSSDLVCTSSSPHNIECAPAGLSKETGLAHVCRFLDISMEEVVAVGDNLNDMEMIKAVGMGIAMENAPDALKEMAAAMTYTNEQDGVAHVIKQLFFDM